MNLSSDATILVLLCQRPQATAVEIGITRRIAAAEVHARLVMLESSRLISSRSDKDAPPGKPRRVYVVTGEGRRKVGISDARSVL